MNNKGKELSAESIVSTTKRMLNKKKQSQKNHFVLPEKKELVQRRIED
jgi:hypothetical protein